MNTHDELRGHSLIPEPEVLAQIPKLYSTDSTRFSDKTIYVHYFCGAANWYVAELDPDDWLAFGYCDLGLGFPEWGYVSIRELSELLVSHPAGFPLVAERDLHFTATKFGDLGLGR